MIQFGVRGHDFGKQPLADLAAAIADKGFLSLQLAPGKALSDIDCGTGKLSTGLARQISESFSNKGIGIAVLGCYINPVHPDPSIRKKELIRFKEHIRFAHDFSCSIVGTETGSYNPDFSFNPLNYSKEALDSLIRSVAELVEEAEKFGVIVCIEAVVRHTVSSPQRMRAVLDAVASNNLQVIYDPVNLMTAENHTAQDDIIKESFDLFGDRIMVIHAKDFAVTGRKPVVVPVGKGLLNYNLFMNLVTQTKPFVHTILEDTKPALLAESREFITNIVANKR